MTKIQKNFRQPPGPRATYNLGINSETLIALQTLQKKYGDMVCITKPNGKLAYFVNDAFEIRRMLTRRHTKYLKGPGFERVKMLLGNGIIVSDGETWRRSRRMIQPAFSRQNIHQLINRMIECSNRRVEHWKKLSTNNEVCNITAETSDFALELILISIFSDEYKTRIFKEEKNPFSFLSQDSKRDLSVVLKARKLRDLLLSIIEDRRQKKTSTEFDFLSMYLQAEDKDGNKFTNSELLDEIMTLIVAGFETSANTLNWAWYLIAKHPKIEEKLVSEAQDIFTNKKKLTADSINEMHYTQQVLEETLRLYPPVWLFTRKSHQLDELDNFDILPNTDIYLSPFILHRNENHWPEPEAFNPDRFSLRVNSKKNNAYYPFSLGPRRCIGEYFSFLEMKIHLGLLLPRFKMQLINKTAPMLDLGINLRANNDILMRPKER